MAESIVAQLHDHRLLSRERGLDALKAYLKSPSPDFPYLTKECLNLLQAEAWEETHGGLMLANELTIFGVSKETETGFSEMLMRLIDHSEARVRVSSGDLLESLCRNNGMSVFEQFSGVIYIRAIPLLSLESGLSASPKSVQTAQFSHIETYIVCLQRLIQALPSLPATYLSPELLSFLSLSSVHQSRFVREAGFSLIGTLFKSLSSEAVHVSAVQFLPLLTKGLEDSCSQIRFAATVSTTEFVEKMKGDLDQFDEELLPRMCLNRCFNAEGVRNKALEAWKAYVGDGGKAKIGEHAQAVVNYYQMQSAAETPAAREAACICIYELASKVAPVAYSAISQHAETLLFSLISCMQDPCWPVQENACSASAEVLCSFPEEGFRRISEVKTLWFRHLTGPRLAMREIAAASIVKTAAVFKGKESDFSMEIEAFFLENVGKAREQETYERSHGTHPPPSDSREPYPWELSDGCVFLLRETASFSPSLALSWLPAIADLLRLRNFLASVYLKDSIWRSIPTIAKGVGKRAFKDQLELFIDEMFRDAESEGYTDRDENVRAVASDCVRELSKFTGPSIFKGRVEMRNPDFGRVLSRILAEKLFDN